MQELLLRREAFWQVANGSKKSTSRRGKRDINLGPMVIKMTENPAETLIVDVIGVDYCLLGNITNDEAIKEGYESIDALRYKLECIYGELPEDEEFTLIAWS